LAPLLRGGALPTGPSLTNLQKGDAIFQTLANEMAAAPQTRTCLEDVLGSGGDASNGHRIEQASKYFSEALRFIKADLEDLRRRCVRLLLLEDEELLLLWGSPALSVEQQEVIVSNSLPRLFPGCTKWSFARRGSAGGEKVRRLKSSHSELSRGGTGERRTVRRDLAVVSAAPSSGPVLELMEPVTLSIQLPEWMDKLEQAIRTSFTTALASLTPAPRPFLAQRLAEASRATRSTARMLELQEKAASDDVGDVAPMPEHVSVTAERIRWTSLVEAWSNYPDVLALLSWHVESRLGEEVARNTASTPDSVGVGAVLMLMLELRALLLRAKAENHQARDLVFLRIAWRGASSVAAALGPVTLEFGWELYGGDVLVCPVGEENFVEVTQHLASLRCPVLQGSSSCSVVLGLAAACGIACHQCYILSDTSSFESLRRVGTAAALLGHWVILHGVDQLERNAMEVCQKFLSRLFQRLAASLEIFRDRLESPQPISARSGFLPQTDASLPSRPASKASNRSTTPAPRFAAQPPGSITVRNVHCVFDFAKLREAPTGGRRRAASVSEAENRPISDDEDLGSKSHRASSWPRLERRGQKQEERRQEWGGAQSGALGVPRILHPATAFFVAPSDHGAPLRAFVFRTLSLPSPDLTLYIHAGLIRIGILHLEAARMLNRAITAFNVFSGTPPAKALRMGSVKRRPQLGVSEVRSVCAFAASLRRAQTGPGQTNDEPVKTLDEEILVCEAWLCVVGTQLDASAEREMLWRCTVMSFGASANFEACQATFRQNLFNDTLMAQRVARKDLSTRFYIQIVDTLRRKFCFDFYNPMVVQKCIATTQALINDRDVAVIGEAGAGKTDCIATLLEAGANFPDDFGQLLFPRVQLIRVNTLAHDAGEALRLVSISAAEAIRSTLHSTNGADTSPSSTSSAQPGEKDIWLTLDGPVNPELFEAMSATLPVVILGGQKPFLIPKRNFRIIVESDRLEMVSPATASSLAITFIDTERGPTWKDRALGWAHRFVLTCPEYSHFMELTKELLMHLMDSILAFVLYYFHYNPVDDAGALTEGEVAALDYKHQTTCFLSCFTSLLVDPVVERQLRQATAEGQSALEREVRLLIGMSSISAFGASLFTHQRPRFEQYIRENVLDPAHARSFPPLYDLYLDSKTGQFQAVGEIVHLTEPILEAQNICVATEEFVAFQLRLRRLLAIGSPVLLAGTAGSGKSTLLRYLHGSRSPSMTCLFLRAPTLGPGELEAALMRNLSVQGTGSRLLSPGREKRLVLFIDDLHLGCSVDSGAKGLAGRGEQRGHGSTRLAEWLRFALEAQGFYRTEDGHFTSFRDTSFVPSLLAPDSQSLEIGKRFSRHFFLAFMEIPSEASIQKIFSTILCLNLTKGIPEEVMQKLTRSFWGHKLHSNVEVDTSGQKMAAQLLQATLSVWSETDLVAKSRLHGLARVFWDVAHAFSRIPVEDLQSLIDVGYLWAFTMRTSVLDALLVGESDSHRRRVYGAVARSCAAHFGLLLGGKAGLEDPDLQALELDSIAFASLAPDGSVDIGTPGSRTLRRLQLVQARTAVMKRLGNQDFVNIQNNEGRRSSASNGTEESEEGLGDEESSVEMGSAGPGRTAGSLDGEFSIDGKFKHAFAPRSAQEELEEIAPDPVSLAMCKELLSVDSDASLMWVMEEQTLCTLLRLCHILSTYPIVCLVGGWTHLPLLSLAGKLLAGSSAGDLHLCSGVTVASLEAALVQQQSSSQTQRRKGQTAKGKGKPEKKVSKGSVLQLLAVGEEDFPAQAPEAFLDRERSRFFRLAGGGLGVAELPHEDGSPGLAAILDDKEEEVQKRLVVVCRSASSYSELVSRCGSVRQTLVATFHVLPPQSLQQVALVYLGNKLASTIDLGALPKQHKKLLMNKSWSKSAGAGGKSANKKSGGGGNRTNADDGQIWQQALFIPLAKILETLHLRIQAALAVEVGQDYAMEFCSACRFSSFVQCVVRLAMHMHNVFEQRRSLRESALDRVEDLAKFHSDLDSRLRTIRVSLKLLVEEARRLSARMAREAELRGAAATELEKVEERRRLVQANIAAVDARYRSDLTKAQSNITTSLRQLKQLDGSHFESLAQYRHLPDPLRRTLGAVQAALHHILAKDVDDGTPIFLRRRVPTGALSASTAAAGRAVGEPKESRQPARNEILEWASNAANKEKLLPLLNDVPSCDPLPGWLAEVLEQFLARGECLSSALWPLSPAASRMSAWLEARLDSHRVLMRMEEARQSMGDLSSQLLQATAAFGACEEELRRTEQELARLEAAHSNAVQKRQQLIREAAALEAQTVRATKVLEIAAPRRRECEVVLPSLQESEESPEQWGAILTLTVLSSYAAPFAPAVRAVILKELKEVLADSGVPTPTNLFTSKYLQHLLPLSFLQKAITAWPQSQLLQSTLALELSGSLCSLIFDPVGSGYDWLQDLHTQRNPAARGGTGDRISSEFDKHLQRLMESRAREPGAQPSFEEEDDEKEDWEDLPQAKPTDQDCLQPLVASGSEIPEVLTRKLQFCMQEGFTMIIRLEDLSPLHGFVGTLLVLLSGASTQAQLSTESLSVRFFLAQRFARAVTIPATADVSTSSNPAEVLEAEELKVRVFSLLQRLEAALPLAHHRFHLYVMAPRCPWSSSLWGPAKTKQVEHYFMVPSALWSTCHIVSMDSRPAHPAHIFVPSFIYGKDSPSILRKRQDERLTLAAQTTRLVVVEELLLHLIGNMENSDMQSDKVMRLLQKLSAVSARLAAVASQGLMADAARKQHSERKFLKLAGTVALLQCALIDMELACETMRGVTATTRKATASRAVATDVHAEVDGGALRPAVLQVLLQHQLKRRKSAKQAVSDLLELVLSAQGPRPGALLKGFVHIESAHGTNPGLVALWDSLVLGSIHKNAPMDAVRILGRRGSPEMGKEALKKAGTVNLASSPSEGTDDSEDSDEEDEDYDGSSDETSSEEEDEDEESEGRNDGAQEAGEEEEGKKGDEADDDFAQDVLENVPAARIQSAPMIRRLDSLWGSVEASLPEVPRAQSPTARLAKLPARAPLLVTHNAIPILTDLATKLSITIQDEVPGGLSQLGPLLAVPGTWHLMDLADVKDFRPLESALISLLDGTAQQKKVGRRGAQVQASVTGQGISAATALLWQGMQTGRAKSEVEEEPSRLIFFCSVATAEIPRSILRLCFCIQNVAAFFGIAIDDPAVRKELDISTIMGERRISNSSYMSGASQVELVDELGHAKPPAEPEGILRLSGAEHRPSVLGSTQSPLLQQIVGYLAHRHPLLTVGGPAWEKHGSALLSGIVAGIQAAGLPDLAMTLRDARSLPDWLEQRIVGRAQPWLQRYALGCVLQGLSPTLSRFGDSETYQVLGALSAKLSRFLQLIASASSMLTLESPFWLRLELHRASLALEAAKNDVVRCHTALGGDACWNAQLDAVYHAAAHGCTSWDRRPLAAWLTTWSEHVSFLSNWDPKGPLDAAPFRLASVSDISTVLSSYYNAGGQHHLRIEEANVEAEVLESDLAEEPKTSMTAGSIAETSVSFQDPELPRLKVEGLRLVAAQWSNGGIERDGTKVEYEVELPPMVICLSSGVSPSHGRWYLCPLVIAYADAFGTDLADPPVAHVYLRTSMNPALCALHGVRLVSFA